MPLVYTEYRGGVRHLVLNRPEKRNALNGELIGELAAAVEAAATDDEARVVVLRGEGPMFSSGMDLRDLRDLSEDPGSLRSFRHPVLACWNLLEEMPKPTICQIHGACLGGAFELALACDFRTMAEDAVAGIMEVRVGLLPDVGGCSRLPAVVGLGNAKELIMTGKVIDGREAHRIGYANRIASADGLDAVTNALAGELLACAPRAVGMAKRIMDGAAKPALAVTLEQEVAAPGDTRRDGGLRGGHARLFRETRPAVRGPLTAVERRRARMPWSGPAR
jgi:enoyl-CoA hydratase/carnithine racemase